MNFTLFLICNICLCTFAIVLCFYISKLRKKNVLHLAELSNLHQEKHQLILESVIKAQEDERRKISADLHDAIGINISTVMLNFSRLEHELKAIKMPTDFISSNLQILENTINTIRAGSYNLYPTSLRESGFIVSLQIIVERIKNSNQVNIQLKSEIEEQKINLSPENILQLFRICQEVLNNILKHSKSKRISINLSKVDEQLLIIFKNDGIPFSSAQANHLIKQNNGLGLASITNRVNLINGEINYFRENNYNLTKISVLNKNP